MYAFMILAVCILPFVIFKVLANSGLKNYDEVDKNKIDFYNECLANNIRKCETEYEIQRASLIAKKYKLKFSDINKLFNEAKNEIEKEKINEKNKELNAIKKKEKERLAELERGSKLSGRNKRIASLTVEKVKEEAEAKKLWDSAFVLVEATQQKELDWATHGGIASGIAGPAAGVAVATDIQIKNAKIRAQNEANYKAAINATADYTMSQIEKSNLHSDRAKELEKEIDATRLKLVSDDSAETCLKNLEFSDVDVSVSETGTCTITARARLKKPMTIFDNIDAVVDGTIIAKLYYGVDIVDVAYMVLPTYGIDTSGAALAGKCLFCGEKGKKYNVKFDAINLWAMER